MLERAYRYLESQEPHHDAARLLILRLIQQLDLDLLDHEKTRLREKGYRFP